MADEPHNLIIDILRGLQGDMTGLKAGMAELRADVRELKLTSARLERRMDQSERNAHVHELKTDDLRELLKSFWSVETKHESQLDRLERRVRALEARQEEKQ